MLCNLGRTSYCVKIICKFFSKHINKTEFFLCIIEGHFFYCEIKCKQGVKIFEKHPNKTGIFLRIVEGVFWMVFFFWFSLSKIFSRIIWKEVFVCVKIAAGNFFFCRTGFLMNGYRPTSSSFILFSFGQRTRRDKVFGRCLWLQKAVRCVHLLAEKFCIRWKAAGT